MMEGGRTGPRTRVAPTPSGYLHAGNAINFLLTQALAHQQRAAINLRIDDLDDERARPEYIEDIFRSMEWLGVQWDNGPMDAGDHRARWSQQYRLPRYLGLADALREAGHLYACSCSRSMLQNLASTGERACMCHSMGRPFDAPDTAWRLHLPMGVTIDLPRLDGGIERVELSALPGDPVLRQRNGRPAYHLASLADDVDQGISFIVRGSDLLPSSACQRYIAQLLGLGSFLEVEFLHHPLVLDERGGKLSKSAGSASLKAMREAGASPRELIDRAAVLLSELMGTGR